MGTRQALAIRLTRPDADTTTCCGRDPSSPSSVGFDVSSLRCLSSIPSLREVASLIVQAQAMNGNICHMADSEVSHSKLFACVVCPATDSSQPHNTAERLWKC
jgi:hypothetical protein